MPGSRAVPLGATLFVLPLVFTALETSPRWAVLHLDWPPGLLYGACALSGALGGVLLAGRAYLAAAVGGMVASLGVLGALLFFLARGNYASGESFLFVGLLGALPGVALFRMLGGPPPNR